MALHKKKACNWNHSTVNIFCSTSTSSTEAQTVILSDAGVPTSAGMGCSAGAGKEKAPAALH